jgi:DNA-binding NarL/FixJ family response regulator
MGSPVKKPTIVLADDHPGNLDRISRILGDEFEILAEVADGVAAFDRALELQPDILILDLAMPKMNGIQTGRELRKRGFTPAILFLTIHADADYLQAMAEIGAGYVSKIRMQAELVPAVRAELRKRP